MIFNYTKEKLEAMTAFWTASEIAQQPTTWKKTLDQIQAIKEPLHVFLQQVLSQEDFDIILTGAGTSEFVGNATYPFLTALHQYKVKSFGTTDIVAAPEVYLSKTKPTLLVSFGRSGNSPESVGAVEVANKVCDNIFHLFITCNSEGELSKYAIGKSNCFAINLTPETHDQSFAMTSSFTNMYLAVVLALNLNRLDEMVSQFEEIIVPSQTMLEAHYHDFATLVNDFDFNRIVYLGSNSLKGVAQESALKINELSAGRVATTFDTPLGFRHGPKSVVNDQTLVVIYLSDDTYTRQYELDLVKEISSERGMKGNKLVTVSSHDDQVVRDLSDYFVTFNNQRVLNNIFLGLEYILVAQMIALFKSLKLNLTPDNPFPTGEVNRVVKGVTIYPY